MNLPANLICGKVSGDSARLVSDRFGRILQEKTSTSTGSRDSSQPSMVERIVIKRQGLNQRKRKPE